MIVLEKYSKMKEELHTNKSELTDEQNNKQISSTGKDRSNGKITKQYKKCVIYCCCNVSKMNHRLLIPTYDIIRPSIEFDSVTLAVDHVTSCLKK